MAPCCFNLSFLDSAHKFTKRLQRKQKQILIFSIYYYGFRNIGNKKQSVQSEGNERVGMIENRISNVCDIRESPVYIKQRTRICCGFCTCARFHLLLCKSIFPPFFLLYVSLSFIRILEKRFGKID